MSIGWRWCFLLCAVGCSSRPLEVPERGADLGRDLGGVVDASRPPTDGGTCIAHQREPIALGGMHLQGGGTSVPLGRSVRIVVDYNIRAGCDAPADLTSVFQVGNATDFLTVTAFVWRGIGPCVGAATTVRRVLVVPTLPGENGVLAVRDMESGSSALAISRFAPSGSSCAPIAPGQACVLDCSCAAADPGAHCLSLAGGDRVCGHACTEDLDCTDPSARFCIEGDYRCQAAPICRDASSCPAGQRLMSCRCEPFPAQGGLCSCDEQCSGNLCNGTFCFQPCVTAADCGTVCSGEGCAFCTDGMCTFTV